MKKKTKKVQNTERKFIGSWIIFFLWILIFWPIAIIYFFMKWEKQ